MTEAEILKQYQPLVHKLAYKYIKKAEHLPVELEDLVSEGNIALIEAYRTHNESKANFTTYAFSRISFKMSDTLTLAQHMSKAHMNWLLRLKKIQRILGEDASDYEIIKYCEKEYEHAATRITKSNIDFVRSLAKLRHNPTHKFDEDGDIREYIVEEDFKEELLDYKIKRETILSFLKYMPTKYQRTILGRMEGKTLEEISQECGCTSERIRQIEAKALTYLQKWVKTGKPRKIGKDRKTIQKPKSLFYTPDKANKPQVKYYTRKLHMIHPKEYALTPGPFKLLQILKRYNLKSCSQLYKIAGVSSKGGRNNLNILQEFNVIDKNLNVLSPDSWNIFAPDLKDVKTKKDLVETVPEKTEVEIVESPPIIVNEETITDKKPEKLVTKVKQAPEAIDLKEVKVVETKDGLYYDVIEVIPTGYEVLDRTTNKLRVVKESEVVQYY